MKLFLALFLLSSPAFAFTDQQTQANFDACVKFLKLNPADQAAVAKKAKKPLSVVMSSCQLLVKQGVAQTRKLEHEYQAGVANRNDWANVCYGAAQLSKDPCAEIKNADLANLCYGASQSSKDPCAEITDNADLANVCYGASQLSRDPCAQITDNSDLANLCYGASQRSQDPCAQISDSVIANVCYGASQLSKDPCAQIK